MLHDAAGRGCRPSLHAALAFEISITNPIIGPLLTVWIATYGGNGALLNVTSCILNLALAEVLLVAWALNPGPKPLQVWDNRRPDFPVPAYDIPARNF